MWRNSIRSLFEKRPALNPDTQSLGFLWACPGFVDRLALSVFLFSHSDDHGLW
jgi:hypothetical protein